MQTSKRNLKIFLSLLLVVLTALSCITIFGASAAGSTTVYFYNGDNWSEVYAYEWSTQLSSDVLGVFPGTKANSVGNGWYSVNVPLVANGNDACYNIIFNNNNGSQYEATIIDTTNVYMINRTDVTFSSMSEALGQPSAPSSGSTRVYFYNADSWAQVYAYEYSATGLASDVLGAWPGTKATSEGDGWYYVDVPLTPQGNDACFNIIFNSYEGDASKKVEATIIDTVNVYMTNKNDTTFSSKSEAIGQPSSPSTPSAGTTRVYFLNSENWSQVYAYEYSTTGLASDVLGAWPGKKATFESGNWYYVDVPLVANGNDACFNIIFNNNGGDNNKQYEGTIIDNISTYLTAKNDVVYSSKSEAEGTTGGTDSGNSNTGGGSEQVAGYGCNQGYTAYQAESASTNAYVMPVSTQYGDKNYIQTEAIGRQAVKLSKSGDYVEFTLTAPANALVLRACIPDSSSGNGQTKSLSIYINGVHSEDISITSNYSWLYGAWPYNNNPGDYAPHKFFDDTRVMLKAGNLSAGTTIKFQKDSTDNAEYYIIDQIECEQVAAASSKPSNYLSITDFGATANDSSDDANAIINCINAAKNQGKGVWIPAGEFIVDSNQNSIEIKDVTIKGAGMWHSVLKGYGARFMLAGNNCKFYDFSLIGTQTVRNNDSLTSAFDGTCPSGGVIQNVWMEHAKCGIWLKNTSGMQIKGCRIRNMFADGINLCSGTTNTVIENCSVRNSGDDSIAIWSASPAAENNTITHNTVEAPQMASGIAVYGGTNNTISNNVIRDIIAFGGGINISKNHSPTDFSGTLTVCDNILYRADSYSPDTGYHMGAIWFWSLGSGINSTINIERNYIYGTNSSAVTVEGEGHISQVTIKDLGIYSAIQYGFDVHSEAWGSMTLDNVAINNTGKGNINNASNRFTFNYTGKGAYTGTLPEPDIDTPVTPPTTDPTTPTDPTNPSVNTTRVHFYNADNWSEVYAYEWSTQFKGEALGSWPGTKATAEGSGWYYVDVPLVAEGNDACFNIIFNNNGGDNNKQFEATIIDTVNVYMINKNDVTFDSKEAALGGKTPTAPKPTEPDPSTPAQELIGDADGNGIVNVKDATAIQKHSANIITLVDQLFKNADFNGDGTVNVKDATAIQKKVANLI
ncbi:MAG: starch-binding protein [Ruminococcus sp.]